MKNEGIWKELQRIREMTVYHKLGIKTERMKLTEKEVTVFIELFQKGMIDKDYFSDMMKKHELSQ